MEARAIEQHGNVERVTTLGGVGEGCSLASDRGRQPTSLRISTPLPGLEAYGSASRGVCEGRELPGLRARSYRDFRHTAFGVRNRSRTGIRGTPLQGFGAGKYREAGHEGAGSRGTNELARTGIAGTDRHRNRASRLRFWGRNSVSINSCSNSPTRGASFSGEGREP